jgi:hypothetical protein
MAIGHGTYHGCGNVLAIAFFFKEYDVMVMKIGPSTCIKMI